MRKYHCAGWLPRLLSGSTVWLSAMIMTAAANSNIVGYWRFNDGAGTNIADISDYGHHGTLYTTNAAENWIPGVGGTAMRFNGTMGSSYVNCGTDNIFNFQDNNAFTVACWLRPNCLTNRQFIIGKYPGGWAAAPFQWMFYADGRLRMCIGGGGTNWADVCIPATNFTLGEWCHATATYDGQTLRGYLNGVEQAVNVRALTLASNTVTLRIGRSSSGSEYYGYYYDGDIDDVVICNYALDPANIHDLYENKIGCWEMNEGAGTITADGSVFTNHAVLVDMDESAWTPGQLDAGGNCTALSFDGINDYVDCGTDNIFNFQDNNAFTVACWLQPDRLDTNQCVIGKYPGGWAAAPFQWMFYADGRLRMCIGGGGTNWADVCIPATNFAVGAWCHATATYDGQTLRGYLNGVEQAVKVRALTLASNTTSLKIGRSSSGHYYKGVIDDVRLYDRAFSAGEVARFMQMLSARPDRNYYTGEDAVAICTLDIACATGLVGNYCLVAKDAQGAVLGTNSAPGMETDLVFSTSTLPAGTNTITVELRRNSGELLRACQMDILVRSPRTGGGEVKVDLRKGIVLRNGTPFFPIGLYCNGLGARNLPDGEEDVFALFNQVGFNTLVRVQASYTNTPQFMNLADQYGLAVINWNTAIRPPALDTNLYPTLAERLAVHWAWYTNMLPAINNETTVLSAHSNLLAYYSVDEPNLNNPDEAIAVAEWYWNTVHPIDPYRPKWLLYARSIPVGENWTRWGDVLGYDVYPGVFMGGLYNDPGRGTAYYAWQLRERCRADRKAMWFVPLANTLDPLRTPIGLNQTHMLCQAYAAVIYGARGLLYFAYPNVIGMHAWEALQEVAGQMQELEPALLNGDIAQNIAYTPGILNPAAQQFPMVNAAVFKYPAGDYLLLAVNVNSNAVDATFTVTGLLAGDDLFNTCSALTLNGESFSDLVEGYGTRAYRLTLAAGSAPVQAAVAMTERTDLPADSVAIDAIIAQIQAGKNYCPNPCFERQFNANIPDFYRPYFNNSVDPLAGETGSTWYVDHENCWDGVHPALRIYRCATNEYPEPETWGTFGVMYPPVDAGMTFSFYARGGQNGDQLWVRLNVGGDSWTGLDYQSFTVNLTTNWQRFQTNLYMEARAESFVKNGREILMCPSRGDAIWVSGLQLELGSTATAFQDDSILP